MAGIGDLVAKLGIDNSNFVRGVKQAESLTSSMSSRITGFLTPIAASFAGAFAFHSIISGAKEAVAAEATLTAVLKAQGGAVGVTTAEIKEYAAQLQEVTNFEDDATVAAASMLASMGNIRGDNLKQAIALSQDLATVMKTDVDTAARKLGKSLKDLPVDQVSAKLAALQGRVGGAAKAAADPFTVLKNTIGEVGETIGLSLLPLLNSLANTSREWLVPMNESLGRSSSTITAVARVTLDAVAAFVALKAVTIAYGVAQRIATIHALIFQGAINPALLLKAVAGIALATAAVVAMDLAMSKVANAAPVVADGLGDIGDAADGIGGGVKKLEKTSDVLKEIIAVQRNILNEGDERKNKIDEMMDAASKGPDTLGEIKRITILEKLWKQQDAMIAKQKELKDAEEETTKAQQKAADKVLEHKERAAELNDELAVLAGTMTKQEAAARALERQGFTAEQAADLAQKQAQIDAGGKPTSIAVNQAAATAAVTAGSQEAFSIIAKAQTSSSDHALAEAKKQTGIAQNQLVALNSLPEKINRAMNLQVADIV